MLAEVGDFRVCQEDISEAEDIRQLVRSLYPDGHEGCVIDCRTAPRLHSGVFYDAAVRAGDLEGTIDVLRSWRRGWELVTIESGTSVKGSYLDRMYFLAHLADRVGLDVERCTVLTLDRRYRRDGALAADALIRANDVTASVKRHAAAVEESIAVSLDVWRNPQSILADDEYRCRRPDTCDACGAFLPIAEPLSIFTLHRGGETARRLYRTGVRSILEIPADVELSESQRIQINAARTNSVYVDVAALRRFLSRLRYPLRFLDFEAFTFALPRYRMNKPWQHIAFQYSLHRTDTEDGPIEHVSYIAEPGTDPRPGVVESLFEHLGEEGSIVVYGRTFEAGVLKRLGGVFARYDSWARSAVARVVDLSGPFHSFAVYHPAQNGRVSMKRVLPALTGVDYSECEIGDGRTASVIYQALSRRVEEGRPIDPATRSSVFRRLEEYCALDTYGMVLIYRRLRELAAE